MNEVLMAALGATTALTVGLLVLPFGFQKALLNDPEKNPNKMALWTKVEPWQTKAKVRNGRFIGFIRSREGEGPSLSLNPWKLYDWYCWRFGLRLIGIPGLQTLLVYKINKLKQTEKIVDGKHIYLYTAEETWSDHVRTRPFTFHFMVSGAEVESVPISVVGSIQAYIRGGDEYDTFFNSDSWTTLLNEAINSVIPTVIRSSDVKLGDLIGQVSENLWETQSRSKPQLQDEISDRILTQLKTYVFKDVKNREGKLLPTQTLSELISLEISSVNIKNFIPDIDDDELKKLRSAVFGREIGRGRDLEGQGEAKFQAEVIAAAKAGGAHGHTSLQAEALVRATKNGSLDTLLAALTQKITNQRKD